jgi:hypothetical protein
LGRLECIGMPNKNYIRGANFERSILNKLKEIGYDGMRSAGSHSCADLIVWTEYEEIVHGRYPYDDQSWTEPRLSLYLIQCKHSLTRDASLETLFKEENVVKLAAMPDKFTKVIVIKQPRSIRNIQFVYDGTSWKLRSIFDV